MKKYFVLLVIILLLAGCKDNSVNEDIYSNELIKMNESLNKQLEELSKELSTKKDITLALTDDIKTKNIMINTYNQEKEYFRELSEKSLEFSRARASGDIDKLRILLSGNVDV